MLKLSLFFAALTIGLTLSAATGEIYGLDDPGLRKELRESPMGRELIDRADKLLEVKPLDPADLSCNYVLMRNGKSYWPVKIGEPMRTWMNDLGFAYLLTHDPKYSKQGVKLLVAMVKGFPPTHPMVRQSRFYDLKGWFMWGMALGCFAFRDTMTRAERDLVAGVAAAYIDDFLKVANDPKSWWYEIHNYNGIASGAAGALALAFREYPGFEARRAECDRLIRRWLELGFTDDGAYREGIGYAQYGLSYLSFYAWLLKRSGGENLLDDLRLRRLPEAFTHNMLPGLATIDARNDSDYVTPGVEMLMIASLNRDPLAVWLLRRARFKKFPWRELVEADRPLPSPLGPEGKLPLGKYFRELGLAEWRTGWGGDDVMFSIASTPWFRRGKATTHAQADKGHFSLYAFGQSWALDPGYGNDFSLANSRSRTDAHSCVLVDGKGQGKSNGHLVTFLDTPKFGYALADCTEGYNAANVHVPVPGAERALRHALFLRPSDGVPAYAAVFDDFVCDGKKHEFTWQLVTGGGAEFVQGRDRVAIRIGSRSDTKVVTPSGKRSGAAELLVKIDRPGEYHFFAFTRAAGAIAAASDSFFVSVDDGRQIRFDANTSRDWGWSRLPEQLGLSAGIHRIKIHTREPDAECSAVFLTTDPKARAGDTSKGALLTMDNAKVTGGMQKISLNSAAGARLEVVPDAAVAITGSTSFYTPPNRRGNRMFDRLRLVSAPAVNPLFAVLLFPLRENLPSPEVKFSRAERKVEISVVWPSASDLIVWRADASGTWAQPEFSRSPVK